ALVVFAEALGISPSGVFGFFRERPLVMLRSLVAALILVPAAALGLILVLQPALAIVTVPLVLRALATPLGFSADVDPVALLWILAKTILLPIGLGLAARA